MKLVIDLQGAQCENRFRGIGRYSLSIAQALVRNRGEHEVIIALNGMYPDTIMPIRHAFYDLLPSENIQVWDCPFKQNFLDPSNAAFLQAAQLLRESFLASFSPDYVLVTSFFEGFGSQGITSIGMLSDAIPTAVILQDPIPVIYQDIYLDNSIAMQRWYLDKIDHLQRANLLLAISDSSSKEAVKNIGFDGNNVINILGAAENCFSPGVVSDVDFDHLKIVYQVSKPFVMYTGGIDHRKNIEGLIEAYANLPIVIRSKYQLVIVCSIEDSVCNHVKLFAKNKGLEKDELILTRYVSDQDLLLFYRACRLFVFPSWHEGFALPVLEAMQCGKAVIASNTTSLPEIVGCEDALFNPHDISSITKKIQEVLTNDVFRTKLEYHGLAQSKKFSWDESARRGWSALTSSYKNLSKAAVVASPKKLPRLAYFSPLPPEASGISDYSAELLPELVRYYEIDVILTQEKVSNPWIQKNCSIRNVAWFK